MPLYPRGNSPSIHYVEGSVDLRANMAAIEKRKIACMCLDSNPDSSIVQPSCCSDWVIPNIKNYSWSRNKLYVLVYDKNDECEYVQLFTDILNWGNVLFCIYESPFNQYLTIKRNWRHSYVMTFDLCYKNITNFSWNCMEFGIYLLGSHIYKKK